MIRRFLPAAVGLAVMAAIVPAHAQGANNYRLMTGPQGGVWVPLGGALKNIWEKAIPGLSVQTLPGAGIANVRGVDEDRAEIGFGNSISTVDGVNGVEPFPRKAANVCQMASLYPQYFQIVVNEDSGINSVRDLRGKAIAVQTRGNTAEVITQHILKTVGMSYTDMKVNFLPSYNDAVSLLKDGHAQAFTLGTTIPASSVMDLATSRRIRVLDLKDSVDPMKKINSGYVAVTLPANTYPSQTTAVTKIGYAAHLIVSCKLPEDRVYTMMRAIQDSMPDLVAVNKAMDGITPAAMGEDIGVPFHAGAKKFYVERGVKM
ncbi:MAG: TAXI family TRAP transporter solute-binding subunit [Alphaproteobacteria bacterium]|nr:TAXI family TRAP transporter solute-binding subunit [Alphaproteobacteria bacterium]MCA0448352.1 TAXI family TRAP transporter solute-binding subunit [Pseudomonadota bacterium]